jgi:hypothetical protein
MTTTELTPVAFRKMNPKVKSIWVDALRSGAYEQAKGRLCRISGRKTSYCCLGVLQDIAVQQGIARSMEDESPYYISRAVSEWSGVRPVNAHGSPQDALAGMNDSLGSTFAQIADWIEENL